MWKNTPAALYLWKDNASIAQLDNCLSVLLRGKKKFWCYFRMFSFLPASIVNKQKTKDAQHIL